LRVSNRFGSIRGVYLLCSLCNSGQNIAEKAAKRTRMRTLLGMKS